MAEGGSEWAAVGGGSAWRMRADGKSSKSGWLDGSGLKDLGMSQVTNNSRLPLPAVSARRRGFPGSVGVEKEPGTGLRGVGKKSIPSWGTFAATSLLSQSQSHSQASFGTNKAGAGWSGSGERS